MSIYYDMELPKGASTEVDEVAKEWVAKYGAEKLNAVAKTHFRTALRAQGLPEPPKVQWKPPKKKKPKDGET